MDALSLLLKASQEPCHIWFYESKHLLKCCTVTDCGAYTVGVGDWWYSAGDGTFFMQLIFDFSTFSGVSTRWVAASWLYICANSSDRKLLLEHKVDALIVLTNCSATWEIIENGEISSRSFVWENPADPPNLTLTSLYDDLGYNRQTTESTRKRNFSEILRGRAEMMPTAYELPTSWAQTKAWRNADYDKTITKCTKLTNIKKLTKIKSWPRDIVNNDKKAD